MRKKTFIIVGIILVIALVTGGLLIFLKPNNEPKQEDKLDEVSKTEEIEETIQEKDEVLPEIVASDITITIGEKLDLNDKFKCIDDVDGDIKCIIEGDYNLKKAGKYKIKVTAKDNSGNKSTKEITLTVKDKEAKQVAKNPYYTEVIRNHNVVVVYGLDNNNEYTKIEKVFLASVGINNKTPLGTFTTSKGYKWGTLVGNLYGQYSTRIINGILFHSVPYYKEDPSTLEWDEFNKLGEAASQGCVRLAVSDVKWIFDNCPAGMTVKIYDGNLPDGVIKPTGIKISEDNPNKGWDPTDPSPNNPWNLEQ